MSDEPHSAPGSMIDTAFKLPKGAVSDPISTDGGSAIVNVLDKQEVTDAEIAANQGGQRGHAAPIRSSRAEIPSGAWVAATIRPPWRR